MRVVTDPRDQPNDRLAKHEVYTDNSYHYAIGYHDGGVLLLHVVSADCVLFFPESVFLVGLVAF